MTPSIYVIVLCIDRHTEMPDLRRGYFTGRKEAWDEVTALNEALGGTDTYPFYAPSKVSPAMTL